MSNYIEAGSIIAIATSLGFWQAQFGISDFAVGLLAALSANAFGAAIGAGLGGPLCDRFGRKAIYTYDLVVYMVGVLIAAFAMNFTMLLAAFVITGIAVGAGIPASWTYIAEQAPAIERARHVGTAQLAWSVGPLIGFALAAGLAPLGLLGSRLIFLHLFVVAAVVWWIRQGLAESQIWKDEARDASKAELAASKIGASGLRGLFSRRVNIMALLVLIGIYGFWNTVAGRPASSCPASTRPPACTAPSSRTCCKSWSGGARWPRRTSGSCGTPTRCRSVCCTSSVRRWAFSPGSSW